MSKAPKRQLTAWERVELCNALELCAGEEFSSISECVTEVCAHFERVGRSNEDKVTGDQIRSGLSGMARQYQNGSRSLEKFLRAWGGHKKDIRKSAETAYADELRKSSLNAPAAAAPGKTLKPTLPETSSSRSRETGSQEVSSDSDVGDVPKPSAASEDRQLERASEESDVPDYNQDTGLFKIEVDQWEYSLVKQVRAQRGPGYYGVPPSPEDVEITLDRVFSSMAVGVQHFLEANPAAIVTTSAMTEGSIAVSRIMLGLNDVQRLDRRLSALFAGPGVVIDNILHAYAATAIFDWLRYFEDCLENRPSAECEQCAVFDICGRLSLDAKKNLEISKKMSYLDKVVAPGLVNRATQYQKHLSDVFLSLITPPGVSAAQLATQPRDGSPQGDLLQHEASLFKWRHNIEEALLEILELRLLMAKSALIYDFRLPLVGEIFDSKWMKVAHIDRDFAAGLEVPKAGMVYLCLRPAVFSYRRLEVGDAPEVLVTPALVILDGHVGEARIR